jgi:hypothetical protein
MGKLFSSSIKVKRASFKAQDVPHVSVYAREACAYGYRELCTKVPAVAR